MTSHRWRLRGKVVQEDALSGRIIVGDGKPALPADASLSLELLAQRRFANVVSLFRYHPRPQ